MCLTILHIDTKCNVRFIQKIVKRQMYIWLENLPINRHYIVLQYQNPWLVQFLYCHFSQKDYIYVVYYNQRVIFCRFTIISHATYNSNIHILFDRFLDCISFKRVVRELWNRSTVNNKQPEKKFQNKIIEKWNWQRRKRTRKIGTKQYKDEVKLIFVQKKERKGKVHNMQKMFL